MQKWTTEYHRIMLVTCNKPLDKTVLLMLKQVGAKLTTWTSSHAGFRRALQESTFLNLRSIVLFPTIIEGQARCLSGSLNETLPTNLVDWATLRDKTPLRTAVTYRGEKVICGNGNVSGTLEALGGTISKPRMYPHSCNSHQIERQSGWSAAFGGREVTFACLPIISLNRNYARNTCDNARYNITFNVLRMLNATLKFDCYADYHVAEKALFRGDVDIMIISRVIDVSAFKFYFFPEILGYGYETFYSWKGQETVSYVTFFQNCWPAFLSLVAAMVAAVVALNFNQYLQRRRYTRFSVQADWVMFLIGSFLATPAKLPCEFDGNSRGHYKRSQRVTIIVWLLGVVPICVYFRGELTSSLAVVIPSDPIDTVDELEAALDRGEFHPCITEEYDIDFFLETNSGSSTVDLREKLRAAFELKSGTANLRLRNVVDCLNSCATRPGFACFLFSLGECHMRSSSWPYVESRETLGHNLISTPVRKDFPIGKQYNKVTRRIFETGLNRFDINSPRWCSDKSPKPSKP
ncbi:hypothetical protein HPB48_009636 [Haemaphysalis longicornis]|uniref:Ionotropic receptor n=1 Tax=Haemaphysalis longicornis TaxID=44386 RepID=A0A9J6GDE4_HAELO|nr:hypothetical protein HPB48_009636 [Haemaphysalis longicornis]